ncbi:hypothetical protein QYE76_068740 [Lolium multiflorum]|uniref:Integrase catalytic domain-containing protein n=1 Tax=Lolium multiflorum TaxID=4521 RepID=A0AAD8SF06_LOLMU|nr:hypothetical protein QYE76_068740 [Lolium multiflorum]
MKMAEMAAVSMEKPSGHFRFRQRAEQRLLSPDLGFAMAAALEGAGIVITSPKGDRLDYVLQIHFAASNNVAEYEAIHGLKLAKEIACAHTRSRLRLGCKHRRSGRRRTPTWPRTASTSSSYPASTAVNSTMCHEQTTKRPTLYPRLAQLGKPFRRVSLEVLKKPSIIPSPDSDSIFVPVDPGAPQPNPGASPKSGANKPNAGYMPNPDFSVQPGGFIAKLGASKPNPPASKPNPATMQSNPEAPTQEALLVSVFEIRCVPSWAQEFLSTSPTVCCLMIGSKQGRLRRAKAYTIINHQLYKRSWIEAKPIKKAGRPLHSRSTFLKEIIVRYGYPHSIITDNGSNFAEGIFKRYCGEMGIRMDLSSVAHPESNGQVEKANGLILAGIRPRLVEPLERSAGCWIEELPSVLWSLRTTPNRSVGFTPFFLVYGAEAVLPTDIEHDAPRIKLYTEAEAKEAREDGVDLVEEVRLMAESRSAIYQQSLRRYHSRKVKSLAFREGDLVLRLIQRTAGQHKLSSPWEGPFIVSKAVGNDSYYLIDAQEAKKNKANKTDEETKRP